MNARVLIVDDDPEILDLIASLLHSFCRVAKAENAQTALQFVESHDDYSVVVVDYRMPGMDGIALLAKIAELCPDTVRILCTGEADMNIAIQSVNMGHIFGFIEKPFNAKMFIQIVMEAVEKYNTNKVERDLLEKTLQSSIGVLTDLFGMVDPISFGRANRMYRYVRGMISNLSIQNSFRISIASLLSQIGCVSLSNDLVEKSLMGLGHMSHEEQRQFTEHAVLGANLIASIPRMETVSDIIRHQYDDHILNREEYHRGSATEQQIGSYMLGVAFNYDVERMCGSTHEQAISNMKKKPDLFFSPFIDALKATIMCDAAGDTYRVGVERLQKGMILLADVRTENGLLIASRGQEVTSVMIQRINAFNKSQGICSPLTVSMKESATTETDDDAHFIHNEKIAG